MIYVFLTLWVVAAVLAIRENKIIRIIVYYGLFSLITSVCFLLFAAPDVAIAEAVISVFSIFFLTVCFEKYYSLSEDMSKEEEASLPLFAAIRKNILPLILTALIFVVFVGSIPGMAPVTHLKVGYLTSFGTDIGGLNAVSAIYLGYRIYDTLFEALLLLVSVVAVTHLSRYGKDIVRLGKKHIINHSEVAVFTIRLVSPLLLLFGIYLIANGHRTAGGGFQGGAAIAAFFVCRYLIYDIYDLKFDRIITLEKILFAMVVLFAALFIFGGFIEKTPIPRELYLLVMNSLIGIKVACGLTITFYRYVAYESR